MSTKAPAPKSRMITRSAANIGKQYDTYMFQGDDCGFFCYRIDSSLPGAPALRSLRAALLQEFKELPANADQIFMQMLIYCIEDTPLENIPFDTEDDESLGHDIMANLDKIFPDVSVWERTKFEDRECAAVDIDWPCHYVSFCHVEHF